MKLKYRLLAFVFVVFFSCKNDSANKGDSKTTKTTVTKKHKGQASVAAVEGEDKNVLQVAMSYKDKDGNKPFSTLVAAVQAAEVEDALVNVGPLTVFAPVNSAFDKLPEGTVATLLKPENKSKLGFILVNHVAPSNYPIKQLKKEAKKGCKLYMASGKYLNVENKDGKIFVGGTEILMSVKVSNGWIHVIGDVLVPSDK
ncbi:MAG: fasciclin domain-containing protein [Flavobacteriaceae bacterium]|nr:fasciclin domain-containing protein [Flavobacteriaceae bacterium]